jgi:hypothetical protein
MTGAEAGNEMAVPEMGQSIPKSEMGESQAGDDMPTGNMGKSAATTTGGAGERVLVELKVPHGDRQLALSLAVNVPGLTVDPDFEPVPMRQSGRDAAGLASGDDTVIVRAVVRMDPYGADQEPGETTGGRTSARSRPPRWTRGGDSMSYASHTNRLPARATRPAAASSRAPPNKAAIDAERRGASWR